MSKQSKNNQPPKPDTSDESIEATEPKAPRRDIKKIRIRIFSYVIVFVLGIITTLTTLAITYPWVTISELRTISPHDPFALRLILRNEGLWPLDNIRVKCSVFSVESRGRSQITETSFEDLKELKHGLEPKHQTNLKCTPSVQNANSIKRAALSISVSFERLYLPWESRREEPPFVYTLERGNANQISWLPEG